MGSVVRHWIGIVALAAVGCSLDAVEGGGEPHEGRGPAVSTVHSIGNDHGGELEVRRHVVASGSCSGRDERHENREACEPLLHPNPSSDPEFDSGEDPP